MPGEARVFHTNLWPGVRRKELDNEQQGTALWDNARLCALLGAKEQAFAYLNQAVEKGGWPIATLNVEPALDNLRGDPRFAELVRHVGLK